MTDTEQEYVQGTCDKEGFDYAFMSYSDFKDIKDEKFHQLREAYIKAAHDLAEYIKFEL